MKRTLAIVLTWLALTCGASMALAQSTAALEAEVREFLEVYTSALDIRDLETLRELYVTDGRFEWIEDGEVRYRSPEEVVAALESLPPEMAMRTVYGDWQVSSIGSSGARASTSFETTFGDGPGAFEFAGMMSVILERDASGWRIVAGHTSTVRQGAR